MLRVNTPIHSLSFSAVAAEEVSAPSKLFDARSRPPRMGPLHRGISMIARRFARYHSIARPAASPVARRCSLLWDVPLPETTRQFLRGPTETADTSLHVRRKRSRFEPVSVVAPVQALFISLASNKMVFLGLAELPDQVVKLLAWISDSSIGRALKAGSSIVVLIITSRTGGPLETSCQI
jgi:hypothetical protein